MESIRHKEELEQILSSVVMNGRTDHVNIRNEFGKFEFEVNQHRQFAWHVRRFENGLQMLDIPVARRSPCMTMIFQFKGLSVFRDKYNPFILPTLHQSLNYFNQYNCRNLVDEDVSQHDMTFVLEQEFYTNIIHESASFGNRLAENVLHAREFNTIGDRQPLDAGVQGVLQNILTCPFKDGMRESFITAQLKAILLLQLCVFNHRDPNSPFPHDARINARDRDILFAVREYLNEQYTDETCLADLSRRFGINEFKLKYGFRKLFDTSPMRYLVDRRMDHAGQLLRNTSKSVSEISDELGYQYANNFSLAFRKHFGTTPNQYRAGRVMA